jgi:hypothetical protein
LGDDGPARLASRRIFNSIRAAFALKLSFLKTMNFYSIAILCGELRAIGSFPAVAKTRELGYNHSALANRYFWEDSTVDLFFQMKSAEIEKSSQITRMCGVRFIEWSGTVGKTTKK